MTKFSINVYNLENLFPFVVPSLQDGPQPSLIPDICVFSPFSHETGLTCEPVGCYRGSLAVRDFEPGSSVTFWLVPCSRSLAVGGAALWRGPCGRELRPANNQSRLAGHVSEPSRNGSEGGWRFMGDLPLWPHLRCNPMRVSEPEPVNTVDSWPTRVWTVCVHSSVDFFQ